MNTQTLNALNKSIEHWERLASGHRRKDEDTGVPGCALCAMFLNAPAESGGFCDGCPVMERTGMTHCEGSPYEDASMERQVYGLNSKKFKLKARKELEFLKSLLPRTNRKPNKKGNQ